MSMRRDLPSQGKETLVLRRVSWIFAGLGLACTGLFALEPDIHAHPQLVLLGVTGLVGTLVLRGLARVFGGFDRPL